MLLPAYSPPESLQANVAAALAPLAVLLAFTAVVTRLIEVDTGLAVLMACAVWVVVEMHRYQRRIDGYNADYVARHLVCRSTATLQAIADDPRLTAATREFVQRFIDAGGVLLHDGPSFGQR